MGTGLKFLFEEEVTMRQGTILGSQIGRWIILAAVVALLGALLLTIRPVGAQDAPPVLDITNFETVYDYPEKGTARIAAFPARDPEQKNIIWTLGGLDAVDFKIEGRGVLSFKTPPNYEVPTDRARAEVTEDLSVDPPVLGVSAEKPINNVYKVTVRIGAGGEDGMAGDDDYAGDDLVDFDLTVNVTNVNETGMLVFWPRQPQVGTDLTPILTDPDNIDPGAGEWLWESSPNKGGNFTAIPRTADLPSDENIFQPNAVDLGKYLRVTVEYVDGAGDESRTLSKVTPYPVRKDIVTSNRPPKYPDQSTLIGGLSPECKRAYSRKDDYRQVHTRDRACGRTRRRAGDGLRRPDRNRSAHLLVAGSRGSYGKSRRQSGWRKR